MASKLIDPDAPPTLYILSGRGEQLVDDGWEPLALPAIYAPAGAEEVLATLPDYREVAAGQAPSLVRA